MPSTVRDLFVGSCTGSTAEHARRTGTNDELLRLGSTAIGNVGLHGNHQSFKSVFDDRVVCLRQFSLIRDAYDDLIDVSQMLRGRQADPAEAQERSEHDRTNVRTQWSAYLATFLTAEEKGLATDLQGQIDQNDAIAGELLKRLTSGDAAEFEITPDRSRPRRSGWAASSGAAKPGA